MSFKELISLNINDKVEKKQKLSYLSWTYAWEAFKKTYPDATYKVYRDEEGRPYVYDKNLGYMCFVSVDNGTEQHEMWLPVMDGANNAMKSERYSYKVKEYKSRQFTGNYIDKWVDPATMFDINKTIMRCFVKCLAMFGLGLYIYSGEDLPPENEEQKQKEEEARLAAEAERESAEAEKRLDLQNNIMGILEKTLDTNNAVQFCDLSAKASKGDATFLQRPIKWLQGIKKKVEGMTAEEIKNKFEEMKK